jgi:hypothetical protein
LLEAGQEINSISAISYDLGEGIGESLKRLLVGALVTVGRRLTASHNFGVTRSVAVANVERLAW